MTLFNQISNGLGINTGGQAQTQNFEKPAPLSGFSISEFKTNVLQNGILKNNLYLVNFQQAADLSNQLMFFTNSVNIPPVDLDTFDIRRYGYGPIEHHAYRPVFNSLQMSFMVEATQKNVLTNTLGSISKISAFMNYNNMSTPGVKIYGGAKTATPYEIAYKGNYEFQLQVFVYDENQDQILVYTFRQCFAKQVSGISLDWANNDGYLKAEVTFSFTDYSIEITDATGSQGTDSENSISKLTTQLGLSSISETFTAIRQPQSALDAINQINASVLSL